MKRKHIIAAVVALLITVPALAVFNEKDLGQTLSVLRYELSQELAKRSVKEGRIGRRRDSQHRQLVKMMKECNELALMLYSQNQDYTFDMTYALKEVTKHYEDFNAKKLPFDDIIGRLDIEIDRYARLVESLRRLPPQLHDVDDLPDSLAYHNDSLELQHHHDHDEMFGPQRNAPDSLGPNGRMSAFFLDEQGQEDRDSCLAYAVALLKIYSDTRDRITDDSEHYEDASVRLKESYDYAQDRYKTLQRRMFTQSQDNFFKTLRHFKRYWERAMQDARSKYGRSFDADTVFTVHSEWRGPVVVGFMGMVLLYLLAATILSVIAVNILKRKVKRLQTDEFRKHIPCLTLFCGVVIFAVSVSVAANFVEHNFFGVASQLLLIYSWLLAAILLSLLIRLRGNAINAGMKMYMPVVVVGLLVITFRIVFIPNSMMNIVFPPLLLLFLVWQALTWMKTRKTAEPSDKVVGMVSLLVFAVTTVMAWSGYVLLSVLVVIWWLFQVAAVETVIAIRVLLEIYERKHLEHRIASAKAGSAQTATKAKKGLFIRITWFYDLIEMAAIPVIAICSIPFCIWLALDVFDLTEVCGKLFNYSVFNLSDSEGHEILKVTMRNVVLISALYFVFKYINYFIRSIYRDLRVNAIKRKSGVELVRTNQINLTLANNVIAMCVWGIYIITVIVLLRIPMGSISIIAAGLATGLGLAMKDILNNFIYSIQLMSGRLREGDWVECDGIRGKVTDISTQSTQIETTDGAVMSFLNADLFAKNFKNLTRNNSYEYVKITVGVSYGTDVEKVRQLLLEALAGIQYKDVYNRDVVEKKKGVTVSFDEFGDSSVDLSIKQFVLVSEKLAYVAKAKEAIYNALNANNIEIPFPQRDIHIRTNS